KKPLPQSVSDVYDSERYQKFLAYKAEYRRLHYIFMALNLLVNIPLILSNLYVWVEQTAAGDPLRIALLTYVIFLIPELILGNIKSWISTFSIEERYGMNKKTVKEFIKDQCINEVLEIVATVALTALLVFVCEHLRAWTNDYSIGLKGALLIGFVLAAAVFLVMTVLMLISYAALRLQYKFTPMPEGPLLTKIHELQAGSKKKVRYVNVYNESKKSTGKNAFLLKLFWHREFGIADNFMEENEERELLAVLSHEIGHLKHKRNWRNYLAYSVPVLLFLLLVALINQPQPLLALSAWVMESFGITVNNYTIIMTVISSITGPLGIIYGYIHNSRSRSEEYEADREAVKNGYGNELIVTFKRLSNDELVDVNPHPLIEALEYDHPGMASRIDAIHKAMESIEKKDVAV
ncbi:MAG: M48 family metalloprotease, partial [Clostridia bacterium]|nr:M48 family metalloprotease [Clostridia bacterium]